MHRALVLAMLLVTGCACDQEPNPPRAPADAASSKTTRASDPQTRFGGLTLVLPPEYVQVDNTSDESPSPIPGEAPTREDFRSYKAPDGNGIFLFHWHGFPTRDRGPMIAEQEWEAQVGGRPARVSLTSTFFGIPQRVLTAHFQASNDDRYLIYMKTSDPKEAPDRDRFMAVLGSIRF